MTILDVDAVLASSAPSKPATATRPVTYDQLRRVSKRWQKAAAADRQDLGIRLERLANGESYAEVGARDDTTWRIVCALAKTLPHADPDALAELFRPSLDIMGEPTFESLREKLVRVYSESTYVTALRLGDGGKPLSTLGNAITVLEHHRDVAGVVGWNERAMRVVVRRPPPWDTTGLIPRDLKDVDGSRYAQWLGVLDVNVGGSVATEALIAAAQLHSFDPFLDWLKSLTWDELARLDRWLVDYAGATDSEYIRSVGSKWVIGAVARAFVPGSKVDTMLILEGAQGRLKSTLLNTLVGDDYFTDSLGDIANKDSCLQLQGPVVVEIAELESFNQRESETVKAFLARRYDRFRAPYGRVVQEYARRCVFAGTTNAEHYLKDRTGHRRFWPVGCGTCDPEGLRGERAQIWAEAVVRFKAGEHWWLGAEDEVGARVEQDGRETGDPWDETVEEWIERTKPTSFTMRDVLTGPLELLPGQQTRAHEMRAASVLKRLGWVRALSTTGRGRIRVWVAAKVDRRK